MGWVNPHITRKVWENTKIQKLRVSYMFHMKQKAIQFPKHGISEFLYHGSSMGKNRQFPRYTYLSDLELMKTLNVWESTNSHNLEMFCGKPYHFQVVVFWGNMGIFFPSSCKIDGNSLSLPLMDLERIFLWTHTILKTWGMWTSTIKKDMGKHKHSEVKGFLNIFHEAEIHAIPKASDEWIPIVPEKYGKKQIYQNGFLDILCEAEIHRNPKPRNEWIPTLRNKFGKTQAIIRLCSISQI